MTSNIEDIEDIFGIPKTKIEREEVTVNEDFSDRIHEVGEVMKNVDETPPVSDDPVIIEQSKKEEEKVSKEKTEVVELDEAIFGELVGEDPEIEEIKTTTNETEPIISPTDTKSEDTVDEILGIAEESDKNDNQSSNDVYVSDVELPEGEVSWITSSISAKFNYFYKQKVSIIQDILRGRQLPFSKYEDELRNSYCDVRSNIFDLPQLYKNMTVVQNLRDRVCQIQSEVNSQYYKWDRIVELLRGVLARTQYERGKQEGIQFEHMRDMEIYLESLKSIHKTADIIHKNLDAASDLLSRQVTIAQAGKSTDRSSGSYDNSASSSHPIETYIEKEVPDKLTDYDDLPSGGVSIATGPKVKKKSVQGVQKINWDEM